MSRKGSPRPVDRRGGGREVGDAWTTSKARLHHAMTAPLDPSKRKPGKKKLDAAKRKSARKAARKARTRNR